MTLAQMAKQVNTLLEGWAFTVSYDARLYWFGGFSDDGQVAHLLSVESDESPRDLCYEVDFTDEDVTGWLLDIVEQALKGNAIR